MTLRRWTQLTTLLVVLAVLGAAAAADAELPEAGTAWLLADLGVGLAFVTGALAGSGPAAERWLFGAAGVAWLVASWLPLAAAWHQAVLLLALAWFPGGRPGHRLAAAAVLVLALLVALQALPQAAVIAAFGVVAILALTGSGPDLQTRVFPALAAGGLAGVLAVSWARETSDPASFDPGLALSAYQVTLAVVALTFPIAARSAGHSLLRLTDRILGPAPDAGLDGLAAVLRTVIADPGLRIQPWPAQQAGPGPDPPHGSGSNSMQVHDAAGRPVALVRYNSNLLDDAGLAGAVASAVRLTSANVRLQEELGVRLVELEAARGRLLAASDRAREQVAAELLSVVDAPLESARSRILQALPPEGPALPSLGIVLAELTGAAAEIRGLVAGVPPAAMGGGRIAAALTSLAERSPVPVVVSIGPGAAAGAQVEASLFYVGSEAITNAVKHARAGAITVSLRRCADGMELVVADDGSGGADPSGSGLRGLADRLAAGEGRLQVDSPPGTGTTLTAVIPG